MVLDTLPLLLEFEVQQQHPVCLAPLHVGQGGGRDSGAEPCLVNKPHQHSLAVLQACSKQKTGAGVDGRLSVIESIRISKATSNGQGYDHCCVLPGQMLTVC
jgi:hypothetical protein